LTQFDIILVITDNNLKNLMHKQHTL